MNAAAIVNQWTAAVKDLFPNLHAHQSKALAALSYAMAASGHVDSGRVAAALPTCVKPASVVRRMERLLANPRLHPAQAAAELTRSLLGFWSADRPLVLILDETPQSDRLRCMKLSVGYRKRAVPLAWTCYRPHQPPQPMPQLLVLAMALATLLALSLGTRVLKRGMRRQLESGRIRKLSLFQLGLRWLAAMLAGHPPLPCTPYLVPP